MTTILVVDDEQEMRNLIDVTFASSWFSCMYTLKMETMQLKLFKPSNIDLVLIRCDDAEQGWISGV